MKEKAPPNPFPILIVEDNPVSRKVLEKNLIKAGFDVVSVEDGQAALKAFQDRFFPIVLSDWLMPGMDGLELCQAIRKKPLAGYVFFILLTAKDSKDDIIRGLQAGADDYLTKPVHHAELMARIRTGMRILDLEKSLKAAAEEIKALSVTDPLTGCFNRRYLNERFPQEIRRSRRYGRSLSIVLCDIDHFKRINDNYGHASGDQVLKAFVRCLTDSIRKEIDWVVRYGGEEFLLVLPETECHFALQAAERLRKKVEAQAMELEHDRVTITSSFGVTGFNAETPDDRISTVQMMEQADRHLYQAKNQGRNRVLGQIL